MLLHPSVFRLRSDGVAFIFPHTITDPSLPRFTLYRCRPKTYAKRHAIILDYKNMTPVPNLTRRTHDQVLFHRCLCIDSTLVKINRKDEIPSWTMFRKRLEAKNRSLRASLFKHILDMAVHCKIWELRSVFSIGALSLSFTLFFNAAYIVYNHC